MIKYHTLKQLKEAYEKGELNENNPLYLDNDNCFVEDDNGNEVYNGGMPDLLVPEMLDLLGIPREYV